MEWKKHIKSLKKRAIVNYSDKITATIKRIQVASHISERHGEPMTVCFSGGKDSQVMLHLVQRAGVPFHAVYEVTTIDHPANVKFIRKNYPHVEFCHPPLNFWQLIEKKKFLPTIWSRYCCEKLKEYHGSGLIAIGVRREESRKRSEYPVVENHSRQRGKVMFYPIIDWLEWEVWQYIEDNGLPVNPCYDSGRRVGCMVCPFAPTKQLISVFTEFPNLKKKMLKTIHLLRETSNYASAYKDKTDEEILEWWMSKKSIAEYFQPRLFD